MVVLERVAGEIRERAAQVREELAERERVFRDETQRLRDELARLDGALRAMGHEREMPERGQRGSARAVRARRGQNRARILEVVGERSGVSSAEVAQATGIAASTVSSTLARLASEGEVLREQLPGGGIGFRVADRSTGDGATGNDV